MEGARARGAQPRLGRAPSAGGAGRGAGARQVRGARGREVGPSRGSGLQPPPWSGRPQQLPRSGVGAVRISRPPPEPCTWCTAESPPAGVRPLRGPGRGLFSSRARGWSQSSGSSRRAHLEGIRRRTGRTQAGDRECGGQVELGRGVDPCAFSRVAESFHVRSTQLDHPPASLQADRGPERGRATLPGCADR